MPQIESGVYIIRHVGGKCYIGSAINIAKRFKEHAAALKRGDHHSILLQRSFTKHTAEAFSFAVLLQCPPDLCVFFEQRCIDALGPAFNICPTAGSRLGSKYSEEAKARLSALRKAAPRTEKQLAHLASLADAQRGKPGRAQTGEQKQKIAAALTGRKQSPELVEFRASKIRGLQRSDEFKQRMSEKKIGRKRHPITQAWI